MSPASSKVKIVSLLLVLNLCVWLVAGSKLENPDWNMWIDKDDGHLSNKRITAKSVFIAPQISKCSEGFRLDQLGKCVQITTVNHANQWQFYLDKLNMMFGKKPEANAVVGGSEPFKVNIPLFGNPLVDDKNKRVNGTVKVEHTTRKQPHFTELFNMQTTFTTNGKTEYASTTSSPTESSTKTESWTSTKLMPESTTDLRDKFETVMWITEKPKSGQTVKTETNATKSQTNTPLPSTTEMGNVTTDSSQDKSTWFSTTQTPPLFEKLGTTVENFSTLDANVDNVETVFPSSLPPPSTVDNTRTTFIPTSHHIDLFNSDTTVEPSKFTIQSDKQSTVLSSSTTTTTTDAPFLIIVTDTNNHIVNTNENEPSVETDYILISNSSSHPSSVNKTADTAGDVSHTNTKSDVKIVDKMCIDSELCNDELVLPYFESTKTVRNDGSKGVSNSSSNNNVNEHLGTSTSPEDVKKQLENSKLISVLQNVKNETTGTTIHGLQGTSAGDSIDLLESSLKLSTSSWSDEKLSIDSSHIYESLKMPPSSPSIDLSFKSDSKKKSEPSTVQNLVNIVHPTSAYVSSTSAYNPKKSPLPTATTQKPSSYSPIKKSVPATPTTQRSPTLTTTRRIFTHGQQQGQANQYTPDSNVYNLMYSLQPAGSDYNANSNEYLFGSSSSYMEPQYASYDSSSYIRFPSDQQTQYKHPNSKFSLDFANTFGADGTADLHSGSNSFVRFPTISRTPASTFNSNQWSNTRWPPHQTGQQSAPLDNAWNSRWPLQQQQQPHQQYYNQNSRYQQNVPVNNYKLMHV